MNKIILLNGPKMSGKDVIAARLKQVIRRSRDVNMLQAHHMMFKNRLFDIALAISGICDEIWFDRYDDRSLKELPWSRLPVNPETGDYYTQRTWLMFVSEDMIKPVLGNRFFGEAAARSVYDDQSSSIFKLSGHSHVHIFSDSGFESEVQPLFELINTEVYLIQLFRDGCTFSGDSRDYLKYNDSYAANHVVHNDGKIKDAVEEILGFVGISVDKNRYGVIVG